MGPLILL